LATPCEKRIIQAGKIIYILVNSSWTITWLWSSILGKIYAFRYCGILQAEMRRLVVLMVCVAPVQKKGLVIYVHIKKLLCIPQVQDKEMRTHSHAPTNLISASALFMVLQIYTISSKHIRYSMAFVVQLGSEVMRSKASLWYWMRY
jgi:hypothetical protein